MFATNINEARIRYWYLCFSTNKCKDFIKNINCEKKKKKKKKKKKTLTVSITKKIWDLLLDIWMFQITYFENKGIVHLRNVIGQLKR